jgi:hypothetical protein
LRLELVQPRGIADCLTWLGGIAGEYGNAELAARLFGAAAKVFEDIGVAGVDPPVRPIQDRDQAIARGLLGEEAFARAWKAGWALPLEAVVTEALAVVEARPHDAPA